MVKKILVVEDNSDSRYIVVKTLQHIGYQPLEAATGDEGVQLGIDEKPDLILMDLGLPGLSGIEATKKLKANTTTRRIPIVAHTAWDIHQYKSQALAAGMEEYLGKPVPLRILKETIEKVCGN